MTFGSLFAGIGGFDIGLEAAGMQCKWQVENDGFATQVLERHWPSVRRWGDVRRWIALDKRGLLPYPDGTRQLQQERSKRAQRGWISHVRSQWHVDLICGGFPCQPVSAAGLRRGEADDRWMWPEFARVVRVLRPRWVLAENVRGLLSAKDASGRRGGLFGRILRDLAESGYCVEWDCIPAAAVGAPHIRDRVFIVGYADEFNRQGRRPTGQQAKERLAAGCCEDVPDALRNQRQSGARRRRIREGDSAVSAADAAGSRLQVGHRIFPLRQEELAAVAASGWWAVEPPVGRLVDGISHRVDQLRCLGNAVVPQVVEVIGRRIMQVESE